MMLVVFRQLAEAKRGVRIGRGRGSTATKIERHMSSALALAFQS
jgi:hypothetical protein